MLLPVGQAVQLLGLSQVKQVARQGWQLEFIPSS